MGNFNVKKITLDNAIKIALDFKAVREYKVTFNARDMKKTYNTLFEIYQSYCWELDKQLHEQSYPSYLNIGSLIDVSVMNSETPYETTYKLLNVLGIELV